MDTTSNGEWRDLVYTKDDHPQWKAGDRVVCRVNCRANDNVIGDVGTITVDFKRTNHMGEWTRVNVRWDKNGLHDCPLPWEISYA